MITKEKKLKLQEKKMFPEPNVQSSSKNLFNFDKKFRKKTRNESKFVCVLSRFMSFATSILNENSSKLKEIRRLSGLIRECTCSLVPSWLDSRRELHDSDLLPF